MLVKIAALCHGNLRKYSTKTDKTYTARKLRLSYIPRHSRIFKIALSCPEIAHRNDVTFYTTFVPVPFRECQEVCVADRKVILVSYESRNDGD